MLNGSNNGSTNLIPLPRYVRIRGGSIKFNTLMFSANWYMSGVERVKMTTSLSTDKALAILLATRSAPPPYMVSMTIKTFFIMSF